LTLEKEEMALFFLGKGVAEWEKTIRKTSSAKDKPIHNRFRKSFENDLTLSARFTHEGESVLDLAKPIQNRHPC